ncbi:DNA polymerase beta superfamily protein [Anaerovibrio sp. RM50]|uniref:DNA polymerase beta superfamily protein n=1 Tax=Anaerovibrio sp. RM50 TaxID=1200557 RepID=UPI0006869AF9|nr:nucleotidyltransferase domain-containing protein [Anaerovibrio sp. RM50]
MIKSISITKKEYEDIVKLPEYSFLNNNPELKNISYMTISGSKAYGTNISTSDTDLRGFFMEPRGSLLCVTEPIDYFEDRVTDTVIYSLKKFVKLAAKCNPNVIEMLGTDNDHIWKMDKYGSYIRENRSLFLSKQAYITFAGYANAQLRRLENALARDSYPQSEKEKHILGSLQAEMLKAHNVFGPENKLKLYIDDSTREDLDTEIFLDADLKHISLRDYLMINSEFSNMLKNYGKLNKRNHKKDLPHLRKHAMHLIRLYYMGIDILDKGEIITYRRDEHDLLMGIRMGDMDLSDVFKLQRELDERMQTAYNNSSLPETVDIQRIDKLVQEIYCDYLGVDTNAGSGYSE